MTTENPTSHSVEQQNVEQQNKALFHRWFEQAWNAGHYEVAHEVISPKMKVHGAGGQPVEMGPDGLIGLISTWRGAFPDGQMVSSGLIAEGDLVAALLTWRGTHTGEFYGIPASGREVVCTSIGLDRIEGGIIVDGWGELDMVGMMQQMGGMPTLGPGASANGESAEWGSPQQVVAGPSSGNEKAVAATFVEAFNRGDLSSVLESGYREYAPVYGATNAEDSARVLSELRAALPDLHYAVDASVSLSEGDLVVIHGVLSGTYNGGGLWGSTPNGKTVTWTQTELLRVAGGKVLERWVCTDNMALLTQIGLLGAGS